MSRHDRLGAPSGLAESATPRARAIAERRESYCPKCQGRDRGEPVETVMTTRDRTTRLRCVRCRHEWAVLTPIW